MMNIFGTKNKVVRQKAPIPQPRPVHVEKAPQDAREIASFYEFQKYVFAAKAAVIQSIDKTDKQGAIENLIILSNLSAKAIYNQNLREIVIVEDAIGEIKKTIDKKLATLKDSNGKTSPEAEYYTLIRLSMIPVCSMLNVIDTHTTAAISQANEEIDDKIQELQRFLVDYETQLACEKKKR